MCRVCRFSFPELRERRLCSIKNLIKLQSGEYIALEHLESTYKSCPVVSNICVHATPDATQPIAIIFPHEVHLRASLPDEDSRTSLADLCAKPEVKALVLKECNATGKKSGFKGIQMLQAVVLTATEWTPESGLVTAAHKLQRKKIAQRYDTEISVRFFFRSRLSCVSRRVVICARVRTETGSIATDWRTGGFRETEMNPRSGNTRHFSPKSSHSTLFQATSYHLLVFLVFFFWCLAFLIGSCFPYTTSRARNT